jgi:hypothetical protein
MQEGDMSDRDQDEHEDSPTNIERILGRLEANSRITLQGVTELRTSVGDLHGRLSAITQDNVSCEADRGRLAKRVGVIEKRAFNMLLTTLTSLVGAAFAVIWYFVRDKL